VHPDVFGIRGVEIAPRTGLIGVISVQDDDFGGVGAVANVGRAIVQPRMHASIFGWILHIHTSLSFYPHDPSAYGCPFIIRGFVCNPVPRMVLPILLPYLSFRLQRSKTEVSVGASRRTDE